MIILLDQSLGSHFNLF